MNKLLNNKFFVGGMVVVAVVMLYFQAVRPILEFINPAPALPDQEFSFVDTEISDQDLASADISNPASEFESESTTEQSEPAAPKVDFDNLRWNENIKRDPFTDYISRSLTTGPRVLQPKSPVSTHRLPGISAIVLAKDLKFVVVDGEIYQEGEAINGFKIHKINATDVALLNESKNKWHRVFVSNEYQ